ncbi:MAG: pilus assembly protein PilP [bacterium]|nr:pilus assembly protein PilP [bacterium]
MKPHPMTTGLALVLVLCLAGSAIVGAQDEQPPELPEELTQAEAEDEGGVSSDELLADEEMMFLGEGYSYEPGERRDPFKSLLIVRERAAMRGPRPEGIPGLLIEEVDLTGIFVTQDGPVAQVRSTEEDKSYLLREGDQLYDGDVVSIVASELTFKQIVDDPTAVKPFREVVKKLNP